MADECKMKPKPLVPGETVFFVVQPRFMNVDIRITVDVTQGSLNLFVSNKEDTFKVTPNYTLGMCLYLSILSFPKILFVCRNP